MTDAVEAQASLEAVLKDEIIRMYEDVAANPEGDFHFFHGRDVAEAFEAEFEGDIFTHVPFRMNMITTTITDTLLRAKELLPGPLALYDVNWTSFYLQCHRELIGRRDRGLDVAEYVGWIPADPLVSQSVQMRSPVTLSFPDSEAARALSRVAAWGPIDHARTTSAFYEKARRALR